MPQANIIVDTFAFTQLIVSDNFLMRFFTKVVLPIISVEQKSLIWLSKKCQQQAHRPTYCGLLPLPTILICVCE